MAILGINVVIFRTERMLGQNKQCKSITGGKLQHICLAPKMMISNTSFLSFFHLPLDLSSFLAIELTDKLEVYSIV